MATETGRSTLHLPGHGSEWYSRWLKHGILAFVANVDPGDIEPFTGAAAEIDWNNQLTIELAAIRDRLDSVAQDDFDAGIVEALQNVNQTKPHDIVLALELLRLAGETGNRPAIHVFAAMVDPNRTDETTKRMNTEAVAAIVDWPYFHDVRTTDALARLARSESFDPYQAREVLRTLCKADPRNLNAHLLLLNEFLQERYDPVACYDVARLTEERRALILELHRLVGPERLAGAFVEYAYRVQLDQFPGHGAQAHDWFTCALHDAVVRDLVRSCVAESTYVVIASGVQRPSAEVVDQNKTWFNDEEEAEANELLFGRRERG